MYKYYTPLSPDSKAAEPGVAYAKAEPFYDHLAPLLGGKKAISSVLHTSLDLIELSRHGLPKSALISLAKEFGITLEDFSKMLHISSRTLQRKSMDDFMNPYISEHVLLLAELFSRGVEVIGSVETFRSWIQIKHRSLDFNRPLDLMDTGVGVYMIISVLGRIEHGVY